MANRKKQKTNRQMAYQQWLVSETKAHEELLNEKNEWGVSDPTPQMAVKNILRAN